LEMELPPEHPEIPGRLTPGWPRTNPLESGGGLQRNGALDEGAPGTGYDRCHTAGATSRA
ncbi:MAG: hypothetical protein ACE5FL_07665, partial [Myxococcota bacterium]